MNAAVGSADRALEGRPRTSVVVPAHNEEASLPLLIPRITAAFDGVGMSDYEIVVVDDGSRDSTWRVIAEHHATDARIHGVRFTRNFGHQAAILAGLVAARGEAVITMDGDGQHPPEAIGEFIRRWQRGAVVVQGVREGAAGETVFKRLTSRLFYRAFTRLAGVDIPPGSADFRLISRPVLERVLQSTGPLLFLRGLIPWLGYTTEFVPFNVEARLAGETSYTVRKMVRLSLDGLLSFSVVPLRLAIGLGGIVSAAAFVYLVYVVVVRVGGGGAVPGWASTTALLSLLGGIQLVTLGILGEYVGRLFLSRLDRPHFVVRESTASGPDGDDR